MSDPLDFSSGMVLVRIFGTNYGNSLAYAEIRLILCKFFFNFDVAFCAGSEKWIDQEVYFLWDKRALMVSLTERPVEA